MVSYKGMIMETGDPSSQRRKRCKETERTRIEKNQMKDVVREDERMGKGGGEGGTIEYICEQASVESIAVQIRVTMSQIPINKKEMVS